MEPKWYALRTEALKENAVEQILQRKGWTVYVPREQKIRRVGKVRKQPVLYPMFPRYILIRSNGGPMPWHEILYSRGVLGVVGFNGVPAIIPQAAVDALARIAGQYIPSRWQSVHKAVVVGDMARIADGPFKDHVVKIEGLNGDKARIFVNLFQSRREIIIPVAALEAA